MDKSQKSEELQSRRQFFKKAAKSALPILGTIALVGAPVVMKAAAETPMGCEYSCLAMCADNCSGRCEGTCTSSCNRGCATYCNGGCSNTCRWTSR